MQVYHIFCLHVGRFAKLQSSVRLSESKLMKYNDNKKCCLSADIVMCNSCLLIESVCDY